AQSLRRHRSRASHSASWIAKADCRGGRSLIDALRFVCPPWSVEMSERMPANDDDAKLTGVGCVLTVLTAAVIFGVAIPVVQWRDAGTGRPLPRVVAIFAPVLVGAMFFAIASGLLRLAGLRVWSQSERGGSVSSED